jgi:hypothetical protein
MTAPKCILASNHLQCMLWALSHCIPTYTRANIRLIWPAHDVAVCHLHRFLFDGDRVRNEQTPEEVSNGPRF